MEIKGGSGATAHGVVLGAPPVSNQFNVRYNLIHDVGGNGVDVVPGATTPTCSWRTTSSTHGRPRRLPRSRLPSRGTGRSGSSTTPCRPPAAATKSCFKGVGGVGSNLSHVLLANNIGYTLDGGAAKKFDFPDVDPANGWADVNAQSRRNLSSDSSANEVNIINPGVPVNGGTVNFVDNNIGWATTTSSSPSDADRRWAPTCPP